MKYFFLLCLVILPFALAGCGGSGGGVKPLQDDTVITFDQVQALMTKDQLPKMSKATRDELANDRTKYDPRAWLRSEPASLGRGESIFVGLYDNSDEAKAAAQNRDIIRKQNGNTADILKTVHEDTFCNIYYAYSEGNNFTLVQLKKKSDLLRKQLKGLCKTTTAVAD